MHVQTSGGPAALRRHDLRDIVLVLAFADQPAHAPNLFGNVVATGLQTRFIGHRAVARNHGVEVELHRFIERGRPLRETPAALVNVTRAGARSGGALDCTLLTMLSWALTVEMISATEVNFVFPSAMIRMVMRAEDIACRLSGLRFLTSELI